MIKYKITKTNNEIYIYGYGQTFTDEDIESLWKEYKILYIKGGIMTVWIEERLNSEPLVHLMSEDDGYISWNRDNDRCFSSYWLDNYIQTLQEIKNRI